MKSDGFGWKFYLVSWLGAFLFFIPFIILAWCNHPSSDDYPLSVTARDWGSYTTVVGYWKCWSARYTSIFLMSVNPLVFGSLWAYKASFFLVWALLFGSFYLALATLYPKQPVARRAALSALAMVVFTAYMPSVSNGFYYLGGALFYIPGHFLLSAALLLSSRLIKENRQDLQTIFRWMVLMGVWALLVGCNEIMLLLALSLSLTFTALAFFYGALTRFYWAISLLVVLGAVALVLASPASFYRLEASGGLSRSWLWVFESGIKACVQLFAQSFSFPALILFLILVKSSAPAESPFSDWSLSQKLVISTASILLYAVCFFPSFLGEGLIQPRTANTLSFLLIVLGFLLVALWLPSLNLMPVWRLLLAVLVICFSMLSANFGQAMTDLYSGDAFTYNKERLDRIRQVETSVSDSVWVKPVSVKPISIFAGEIGDYPDPWYDNFYAQYHGKKFIHLEDNLRKQKP